MNWKRMTAAVLTGLLLTASLAGCGAPEQNAGSGSGEIIAAEEPENPKQAADVQAVDSFQLAYIENDSLNPLICATVENQLITQLCFESLYRVDSNYEPQAELCTAMERNGSKSYTMRIRSDATFHSGQELTAEDVVFSLNYARLREKSTYQEQLSNISSVKYNDDEITVRLYEPRSARQVQAMLDVPIVCKGTEEDSIPDGTGPYQIVKSEAGMRMIPSTLWSGGKVGFCESITLKSVQDSAGAANLMSSGELSLFLQRDAEEATVTGAKYTASVPTTRLHYLGINCDWPQLEEEDVRTALSMLMDRNTIVQACFAGRADAASLPVHSVPEDVEAPEFNKEAALELLDDAGIYDRDDDGYLDISSSQTFKVEIIYNEQYGTKGAVLQQYAKNLNDAGIQTTISPLSFSDCQSKLRRETFQIYYGEYQMSADEDLSPIISDNGDRNFGTYFSSSMERALNKLHSADSEEEADAMIEYLDCFMEDTPIIPIAFERALISAPVELPKGFDPWPNQIFHGVEAWSAG